MHKTFSLRYVARGERSKPTFLIPMSFKKFVYLHILCMKINSLADDASELIILLEDLWVKFVHHIYMFDISYDSLDYDPRLKKNNCIRWLWKIACKCGVISGPYFPLFGLNTDLLRKSPYSVRTQENTGQK